MSSVERIKNQNIYLWLAYWKGKGEQQKLCADCDYLPHMSVRLVFRVQLIFFLTFVFFFLLEIVHLVSFKVAEKISILGIYTFF